MKALPDGCSYLVVAPDEPCGRAVVVDYFDHDPLLGERHISSLCGRHHGAAAKAYALANDYSWTERVAAPLTVVGDDAA